MGNPGEDDSTKDSDINLPPISLPPPDPFDTSKGNPSSVASKKQKKKSKHPLDLHGNKPRGNGARGCCGAIGCFSLIIIVLLVGGIGIPSYLLFKDFGDGYKVVQLEGLEEVISTAPAEPTLYVNPGGKIIYNAPQTRVSIGLVGREVEVSGQFAEKLLIRGIEVTTLKGTHCFSDLNIYAVQFVDKGVRVDGVKEGKTLQ